MNIYIVNLKLFDKRFYKLEKSIQTSENIRKISSFSGRI